MPSTSYYASNNWARGSDMPSFFVLVHDSLLHTGVLHKSEVGRQHLLGPV